MEQLLTPQLSRPSASLDRWTDKFERQAHHRPAQTAVISGTGSISYGELSARSNQIAHLLRSRGIGRGKFVGLGLHRSLDLPAALLGILKSGAAYVPLDPGYSAARIEQMISSANLEYVVTNRDLAAQFSNVHAICMDDVSVAEASADEVEPSAEKDNLIYAIFTSGSSSKPTATTADQTGSANLLHWYSIELTLGPNDSTLVISSPSFDLTQKNFFVPLTTGGTLILGDCQTYDIPRVTELIREHGVTLLNCTPSAFYQLVDAAAGDGYVALSSFRFAVLGGEPISVPRLRAWLEHPNCRAEVVNSYGPTECADICAFHRIHRGNLDEYPILPLGHESPNVRVSIRGESLEILPDGKTGEIEPGLNPRDNVSEALAISRDYRQSAHAQGTSDVAELRVHPPKRLPDRSIPGEFHVVESPPLTLNGRVNRTALTGTAESGAPPINHGGSMESKVLALWSEILDRPVKDPTMNFFDLGGNSIHVAIVHVRLMEMTGRNFAFTELFALPSARAIADFLSPRAAVVASATDPGRARQAQTGLSRFRRPANR